MRDTQDPSPGQKPERADPKRRFWLQWRVLVPVFFVLLAVPAGRQAYNGYEKSRVVRDREAARDAAEAERTKLQEEQNAAKDAARTELDRAVAAELELTQQYRDAWQKAVKALGDRDFAVWLTGPAHVQPGAPNQWKIQTVNHHGQEHTPKKLEIVLKDAKGNELENTRKKYEPPPAQLPRTTCRFRSGRK